MLGLERYSRIIDGQATARYLLSRSVSVEMPNSLTLTELWDIHHGAMEEYRARVADDAPISMAEPNLMDLKTRIASELMKACCLCEHRCMVDRTEGIGRCGVRGPRIASHFMHLGEEEVLVPSYTFFFAGCNLKCVFCQNYDISTRPGAGREVPVQDLSAWLRRASSSGARNINWVGGDPTPDIHFIMEVLRRVQVNIAQVWNSNMYLTEEAMSLLNGTMDIYLTDFKFGNDACALRLCGARDYLRVVSRNHLIAASRGEVIVRHLLLPGHLKCCTLPILDWLTEHMPSTPINIMEQYHPEHLAQVFPELRRRPSPDDYRQALLYARSKGLHLL